MRLGDRARHTEALEHRQPVSSRGSGHRCDDLLPHLRGLPRLRHVVPDIVRVHQAAAVHRKGADQIRAIGGDPRHMTSAPVMPDKVDRAVDRFEFGNEPGVVPRHRRLEAIGYRRPEARRREPDDIVDRPISEFGDEEIPHRRALGVAMDEHLRHERDPSQRWRLAPADRRCRRAARERSPHHPERFASTAAR